MVNAADTALFTDLSEAKRMVGDFISAAKSIIEQSEYFSRQDSPYRFRMAGGAGELEKKIERLKEMYSILDAVLFDIRLSDANRQADVIIRSVSRVIDLAGFLASHELEGKAPRAIGK